MMYLLIAIGVFFFLCYLAKTKPYMFERIEAADTYQLVVIFILLAMLWPVSLVGIGGLYILTRK